MTPPNQVAGGAVEHQTGPVSVTIRTGVPEDAVAFAHLHLDVWDDAYTGLIPQQILDARRRDIDRRIGVAREILSRGRTLLAEYDGPIDRGLVGFAIAGPGRDDGLDLELELQAIYVRATQWGTGLGHRLITEAVGDRDCYLWVLAGNERAIGFYERHGFVGDGAAHDEPEGKHVRMVRRS